MVNIEVLMRYQDDPKKCTAARLLKCGIARRIKSTSGSRKIILNPYSERILMPADRRMAGSIVGIDCSWRLASQEFGTTMIKSETETTAAKRASRTDTPSKTVASRAAYRRQKASRRLPPLLAGNPVNYAKVGMLTTAEAISAALFIMGYGVQGHEILGRFKWGHTFFDLNCNIITEYAQITRSEDAARIAAEYGLVKQESHPYPDNL